MYDTINAEVFLTIAETGSFRKAAYKLGYTPAGISYMVAAMEDNLGFSLFSREHNGAHLTREGEIILPQIRQLQVWERQFKQTINELNGLEKGVVRVQIFDSISIHWIPNIVRRFHDDYPGIKIELITEENALRSEEMVLNGEVDCGFFLTKVNAKLDYYPLLEEDLLAVVAPDHELASLDRFPLDYLDKYPYIKLKYGERTNIGKIFKKCGKTPKTAFYLDNDYAAMAMVSQGLGYGIFPALLLKNTPYELKIMEFDTPQTRVISIGTANINTCSMACRKFIEYTRKWVAESHAEIDIPKSND